MLRSRRGHRWPAPGSARSTRRRSPRHRAREDDRRGDRARDQRDRGERRQNGAEHDQPGPHTVRGGAVDAARVSTVLVADIARPTPSQPLPHGLRCSSLGVGNSPRCGGIVYGWQAGRPLRRSVHDSCRPHRCGRCFGAAGLGRRVDKNFTIVFPAPLMSTIGEVGAFLSRETKAAGAVPPLAPVAHTNGELVPSIRPG